MPGPDGRRRRGFVPGVAHGRWIRCCERSRQDDRTGWSGAGGSREEIRAGTVRMRLAMGRGRQTSDAPETRGRCELDRRPAGWREGGGGVMKVCVPVQEYRGLESAVYGHFGSAPGFAMVETESMSVEPLSNNDQGHVHGACSPVRALAGAKPDAVIVGGMGAGALRGLRSLGIKVFFFTGGTVAEALRLVKAGKLRDMDESTVCAGHSGGHGCR